VAQDARLSGMVAVAGLDLKVVDAVGARERQHRRHAPRAGGGADLVADGQFARRHPVAARLREEPMPCREPQRRRLALDPQVQKLAPEARHRGQNHAPRPPNQLKPSLDPGTNNYRFHSQYA